MSEAERPPQLGGTQACDNCKSRKTKCDRRSPCASCVTLKVVCRTTRRTPEKRQRVLLSSKYDESMQDVSQKLSDIKQMLQTFMPSKGSPYPAASSSQHTHPTGPAIVDELVPSLSNANEGYKGDSSFQSHAQCIKNTLEKTLAAPELMSASTRTAAITSLQTVKDLFPDDADTPSHHLTPGTLPPSYDDSNVEIGNMPLPPMDIVLQLLRLAKAEKQQFFADVPMITEDEFTVLCRDVYFATQPNSLWTWICVNVGLYYLFVQIRRPSFQRLGTTLEAMRAHATVLKANAEAAMQSLRLCSEPSVESCRAIALLGQFYVKEGHSAIAWRLISGAARVALDLGLHRLPDSADGSTRLVFWNIYSMDKWLSMTCGRTPVIHHDDVTTGRPINFANFYNALLDYAVITGEILCTLFGVSALSASRQERVHHVRRFAARIMAIQESVRSELGNGDWVDNLFGAGAALLDIIMHSLLAIVYRILPSNSTQAHPLQCSDESVHAARMALSGLVAIGEKILPLDSVAWGIMLNVVLSLIPLVSFIVLAGHAIATSSNADLDLLSSVVAIMAPPARNSSTIWKMHDVCERFERIARLIVSNTSGLNSLRNNQKNLDQTCSSNSFPINASGEEHGGGIDYSFPMGQQDWDRVMVDFESELGSYDSKALRNIIEPYIANSGW